MGQMQNKHRYFLPKTEGTDRAKKTFYATVPLKVSPARLRWIKFGIDRLALPSSSIADIFLIKVSVVLGNSMWLFFNCKKMDKYILLRI
jgi:hypothetical protein